MPEPPPLMYRRTGPVPPLERRATTHDQEAHVGTLGTTEHTIEIDGKTITFETGKLAAQAGGAVVTSLGDTKVLTTTTASSQPKDFLGFFLLTIEVEERMYASGRIPGSFFKREGRPSENAILTDAPAPHPVRVLPPPVTHTRTGATNTRRPTWAS